METGTLIGPYRIEGLLGRGGMAEVYRAWHSGLHRFEAMKVLPPHMAADSSFAGRFLAEARHAASLHHPHIAVIHSVSPEESERPYFTMEIVEDGDLSDLLQARGALPTPEARPILEQIAGALDYAHGQGIVHRDVKPANILLKKNAAGAGSGPMVKLVDFGIARAQEAEGGTRLTKTGMIVGTPDYMSPEQSGSGAPIGAATDQYSLGVVAYEMLCGQPPFQAHNDTSPLSIIMQHVRDEPRPPIELAPALPPSVNAAILKALAKDPAQRFASCSDFVRALSSAIPVQIPTVAPTVAATVAAMPAAMATASVPLQAPRDAVRKSSPMVPMAIGAALFGGLGLVALGLVRPTSTSTPGPNSNSTASAPVAGSTPLESASKAGAGPTSEPTKLAAASIEVPDLVGKSEDQAREIIKAKSLAADVTTGYSQAFAAQQVMSQFPTVGTAAAKGSPVKIRISLGPKDRPQSSSRNSSLESSGSSSFRPSAADVSDVRSRYASWVNAWQSMDIDSYMSFYSRDVRKELTRGRNHGFSAMRSRMIGTWSKLGYITIKADEPDVSLHGSRIALAANQSYDSSTWWDQGTKRLLWQRENGEWKIVRESFSQSAGGAK